jgi:lysozyme
MPTTPSRALLLAGLVLASCRESRTEPPAPVASSAAASGSHMGMQMELRTAGSASAAPAGSAAAPAGSAAAPAGSAAAEECRDLVAAGDGKLPPIPPGFTVRGVDTSTPGAWSSFKRQGVAFSLHQVMLGGVINKDFQANWRMARACGLPRGAYHFLTPRLDGAAQARTFLQQLGDDRGELLPIVDVELPPGCKGPCCAMSCDDWSAATRGWLTEVERALGRKVWVYTVADFWKECLCNTSRFADRSLWLAGYPGFELAPRPGFGGWQRWGFYQYKGNARLGQSVLDLNVFREGRTALDALIADNARKDP